MERSAQEGCLSQPFSQTTLALKGLTVLIDLSPLSYKATERAWGHLLAERQGIT